MAPLQKQACPLYLGKSQSQLSLSPKLKSRNRYIWVGGGGNGERDTIPQRLCHHMVETKLYREGDYNKLMNLFFFF